MLVQHDQQVAVGEPLFQIHDPELDRLEEELLGTHAVIEQKLVEVQKQLVRGTDANRRAEWEGLRTEYETERASLLRQLDWLARQRQRMEIRSPIDGFVEAWETELTQEGRLARRGEPILEIVNRRGPWQFRAEIPQSRLDDVLAAQQEADPGVGLPVTIVMQAFPSKPLTGSMGELGPTLDRRDGVPFGWTRVAVATEELPLCQSGAAARISIPCGRRALGYVAFRDFLRALVGSWKLWVG
jgi:multidrug efflux pump subunit AcrA (membrane-fusion protein)